MRVAVTGTTGRVGAALVRHLAALHEVVALPRAAFDLADRDSMASALDRLDCDVFVNPAGLTSLEACEDDPAVAMRVNAEAPGEISRWAAGRNVRVIHFSTDYVFDGSVSALRRESDPTGPLSVYGRSKLAGERAVLECSRHTVLRVSWVFGPEKPSFVDAIFDAALAGKPLAAVSDKFSLPTFTTDLAEWVGAMIGSDSSGIYHACNSGDPASWHDLATATLDVMADFGVIAGRPRVAARKLADCAEFRAARPVFSAMDTPHLTELLERTPRPWREALIEYVRGRCLSLEAE